MIKYRHIIIGIENYNTLGLIRTLGENGIKPIVIMIKGIMRIASYSKWIGEISYVKDIEEAIEILDNKYIDKNRKDIFLYTNDDWSTQYFDYLYEKYKDILYMYNAGEAGRVTYYMDKYNVSMLAQECGLSILKCWRVKNGEIPRDIAYPIITKAISPNEGGWKKDVFICHSVDELICAYKKIKSKTVLLQKYLKKKNELCIDGYSADRGNTVVMTIASTYNYILPDKYSDAMVVSNYEDEETKEKIRSMFRKIGYEGIFCIEFLISEDDELFFCEINFRNSGWSYASTVAGMPLAIGWNNAMIGKLDYNKAIKKIAPNFTAIVEFADFDARVRSGMISVCKWMNELAHAKCLFYVGKRDPKPAFMYIVITGYHAIKRRVFKKK